MARQRKRKRKDRPDGAAVYVDYTFETHANTQDGDLACKIAYGVAGDARVGGGVSGTGGDDEGLDGELGEGGSGYGIVADDGDVCTEEAELLVEIPRERVKVVDEQTIDGLGECGW